MNEVPPAAFGEWVHSHEEDTQDTSVYRRPGYDFPPARGRRGFALKRDGGFVWHRIAAADGNVDSMGRWRIEDNDRIVATFEEKQLEPLKLDLISCDGDVLRIKRG